MRNKKPPEPMIDYLLCRAEHPTVGAICIQPRGHKPATHIGTYPVMNSQEGWTSYEVTWDDAEG